MSRSTTRRVIPGIVTLGLAAGAVLIPNAAFASPGGAVHPGHGACAVTAGHGQGHTTQLGCMGGTDDTQAVADVSAMSTESGTVAEPVIAPEKPLELRPEHLASLDVDHGSLASVTVAVPPLVPQGVPTVTPGRPIEELATDSEVTDVVEPQLTPVVPQTLVPVEQPASVTIPLEPISTGSQTPSVADQQAPIPAAATDGYTVVDNGVDDSNVSAPGGADTPQVAAAAQQERVGGDAPAATLSHTGVDDSTLALGGAGLGAVIVGGALLAFRRVRG